MTAGTVSRWAVAALSLAGLALAAYLSVEHVSGGIPTCGVSGGCGDVTTSEYAVLMGVPVAFIGVAGYGGCCCLGRSPISGWTTRPTSFPTRCWG